jgi:hypothetical protein
LSNPSASNEATGSNEELEGNVTRAIHPFVLDIATISDQELGKIHITAHCRDKLPDFLNKQPKRVFFSINGQAHATERASWLNQSCSLGAIMDNIVVNVDCTDLTNTAIAQIFMTDRERMVDNRISRNLKELVKKELKESKDLRNFAEKMDLLRARKHIEDNSQVKDLIQGMVKANPSFKELFGFGDDLKVISERPGGEQNFVGKQFPTFLRPLNTKIVNQVMVFPVPQDATRKLECRTDAANDYFSRSMSPGAKVLHFKTSIQCRTSVSLRNGLLTFTFTAGEHLKSGDVLQGTFGVNDASRPDPLVFDLRIEIGPPELKQATSPRPPEKPGVKITAKDDKKLPRIDWITKADYERYGFNDENTLRIEKTHHGIDLYINRDHVSLQAMRKKERSEANVLYKENIFRYELAIIALTICKSSHADESDDAISTATTCADAIACYFVDLVAYLSNLKLHNS